MKTIYVFLADGFEEIEALGTVDVLRRAGLEVKTVSVMKDTKVTSTHGVAVFSDKLFEIEICEKEIIENAEMLILPGGMPGASNLGAHERLVKLLKEFTNQGKFIAAICAAPMVLGKAGLLKEKHVTCYPGFEQYLEGAFYTGKLVEVDKNFITGKGPGATLMFALTIVELLCGKQIAREVAEGMLIKNI